MADHPVIFIVGATASGKTAASLELARHLRVEIINADSRQLYRGMDIGTAKPTLAERAAVPHHLIDIVDPDEPYSLSLFLAQARQAINDISARGKLPVVVGGTGQYVWALVEGWQLPEVPPESGIRERLEEEAQKLGSQALYNRLVDTDPDAAQAIDPRNVRRVVRALEVAEITGEPFSIQRQRVPPPFTPYVFGMAVPRVDLYRRIDQRVIDMVAAGLIDEVKGLLEKGYDMALPAFSGAGYRQMAAYVRGEMTLSQAMERTRIDTHRLARHQGAWFKQTDPRIHWVKSAEELVAAVEKVARSYVIKSAYT